MSLAKMLADHTVSPGSKISMHMLAHMMECTKINFWSIIGRDFKGIHDPDLLENTFINSLRIHRRHFEHTHSISPSATLSTKFKVSLTIFLPLSSPVCVAQPFLTTGSVLVCVQLSLPLQGVSHANSSSATGGISCPPVPTPGICPSGAFAGPVYALRAVMSSFVQLPCGTRKTVSLMLFTTPGSYYTLSLL